jgi:hypothetical protein
MSACTTVPRKAPSATCPSTAAIQGGARRRHVARHWHEVRQAGTMVTGRRASAPFRR